MQPSLISTGVQKNTSAIRGKILLDATHQFCAKRKTNFSDVKQYKELFYSLIAETDKVAIKNISAILARNPHTPRAIAYYLAMEPIEIAAPFLLISQTLHATDLLRLVEKLEPAYLNVIARRSDVTPQLEQLLIKHGDTKTLLALKQNPIVKLNVLKDMQNNDFDLQESEKLKVEHQMQRLQDSEKLLNLAAKSGKIKAGVKQTTAISKSPQVNFKSKPTLAHRVLEFAKTGAIKKIANAISTENLIPIENVEPAFHANDPTGCCILLKALNFKRSDALQTVLLTNTTVGTNVAKFSQTAAIYDALSSAECQNKLRSLGAKKLPALPLSNTTSRPSSIFKDAVESRGRHIHSQRRITAFGRLRKSG